MTTSSHAAGFEVPAPHQVDELRLSDGGVVLLRRHGNPAGPRLLVSHGNGFAADMYFPLWGRFLGDFEVVVFDLRNHGWNPVGDIANHNVPQLKDDLDVICGEVQRRFGQKPTVGIYHSLSALAVCLSESRGEGYSGLFVLDPPVCKPGKTYEEFDAATERGAGLTRRRQVRFESIEQCAELLSFAPSYRRAVAGACELAANATLRPDSENHSFVLRCPREYEARIIEYLTAFAVLVEFTTMCCPVKVLGSDPTIPYSFLPSFDLGGLMVCDYDFAPEATHMLFIEKPEFCADRILEFLPACGVSVPPSALASMDEEAGRGLPDRG